MRSKSSRWRPTGLPVRVRGVEGSGLWSFISRWPLRLVPRPSPIETRREAGVVGHARVRCRPLAIPALRGASSSSVRSDRRGLASGFGGLAASCWPPRVLSHRLRPISRAEARGRGCGWRAAVWRSLATFPSTSALPAHADRRGHLRQQRAGLPLSIPPDGHADVCLLGPPRPARGRRCPARALPLTVEDPQVRSPRG